MANKKQTRKFEQYSEAIGFGGGYNRLIRQAVIHDWSINRFVNAVANSNTFRRRFPGLMRPNGTIAEFLTGKAQAGFSPSLLSTAISNYEQLELAYKRESKNYGFAWKDGAMRQLIDAQVSPEEFKTRLSAVRTVQNTPGLNEFFRQAAKEAGIKGVDTDRELYRLAAGVSSKKFEDVYETARLSGAGVGLSTQQAAKVAADIGQPGEYLDIDKIISGIRTNLSEVAPELEAAGISRADLARFVADPEADADLAGRVNQVLVSRRAMAKSYVPGQQARRGTGGGLATYEPEAAVAY